MSFFDLFMFAFNAVMPIVLLIVFGYVLKTLHFVEEDFLKKANKFVFSWCLPILLFFNVYQIKSFSSIDWSIVIFTLVVITLCYILGIITVLFIKDSKRKGVILQCFFRSNFAFIGLPLATMLGGNEGAQVASILSAFTIPLYNILAVICLSVYIKDDDNKINIKSILLNIYKNPLIRGVVIGLVVLLIRSLIPLDDNGELVFSLKNQFKFLYSAIEMISKIASPLALVVLGGLFSFSQVKGMFKEITIGVIARLVIVPLIGIGGAILMTNLGVVNFDHTVYPALIALFGSPVAVSSAIMASEMKNDGKLAGQLVVWTSIFSTITIFIFVIVLRSMSLL